MMVALLAVVLALPASARTSPRPHVDETVDILALDVEMARFLVRHVGTNQSRESRVLDLADAIFSKKGLGISYDGHATQTAAETFRVRRGNCLSFTILYVAMARHLGLAAYFEEVDQVISWDRRGEVVVRNQHMVVGIEVENGYRRMDFLPEAEKRYRSIRRISDERALAHYFNNLGVDALAKGDPEAALDDFRRALAADEGFSYAWTNLGVAQRRLGDFAVAESSHLRALEIDEHEAAALTNLASLYLAQGLEEKARPLLRRVDDDLARNPFHHYQRGLASAHGGDLETAIRSFREAIRRMPDEAEFHESLAATLARSGEVGKARTSFLKALELSETAVDRQRLRQQLASLDEIR